MNKRFFISSAIALGLAVLVWVPSAAFGQTTTTNTSFQAQLDMIASLSKQIADLQKQLLSLNQQRQEATVQLVSGMSTGSQGDQVKILQTLLSADASIYPEGLVTGFFGPATARAVKRFQKEHGLEQVGLVGPKTLKLLNKMIEDEGLSISTMSTVSGTTTATTTIAWQWRGGDDNENDNEDNDHGQLCVKVPPGHLIAPGWLRKHDDDKPIVPLCQVLPPGIDKKPGVFPPQASTTPVMLSSVSASTSTSTATIYWMTNKPSTSQVLYGLTPSYGLSTAANATLVTNHSQTIVGLVPNTTYHFEVVSSDAFGNTATSSDSSFTTATLPVVTLPSISDLSVSGIASTTATVSWNTNVSANGTIWYATSTPVATTTASSLANTSLTTGHTFNLGNLTASTTYYYIVQSMDGIGNAAISAEQSFVTSAN